VSHPPVGPDALAGEALVDELARRLDDFDNPGAALVQRLAERLHAKVAVKLVDGLTPVRKLDYERADIWLVMSSPAILKRLGSVAKEPFTVAYIEEHVQPGDVFYDIGANVGPYSLIAAKATEGAARVFAFEPSPSSFRDLARNIEVNECSESVTPLPLALWSETGLLPVAWSSDVPGAARHRIGRRKDGATSRTIGIRLDDAIERLGVPGPTHAKIDTDGHEVEVLRGARQALADPGWRSLIVELDRKETDRNREIRGLLADAGFDQGVLQERRASKRYPDPAKRPDVYWVFTRAA
jgi:FkbM family methyltransferase